MPQLAVYMKVNTQNKVCRNLKIIVSNCGTHHIQTVVPHAKEIENIWKIYFFYILLWYLKETS
ncbi:MAG: hypothetical protein DRJ01_08405 [Bacteroidetes bacterium]|nr:MAG: hypothetical protein DRJ01_08405 [Bacteroidota bacterium]